MSIAANGFPWQDAPESTACNFALGHLVGNLPGRLTIDGRIHAETYISAVGAIAGYAAQRTLFAGHASATDVELNLAETSSGGKFWFGDALNYMLVPRTAADANRCLWSVAAGSAVGAGLPAERLPDLGAMFQHIAATIGGEDEGKSSVPAKHQPQWPAGELLKAVWPMAAMCFSGKFPGATQDFGAAPVAWWSAIAARAAGRPVQDVKTVLLPDIALTLLMESAIYCSKLQQSDVEGA